MSLALSGGETLLTPWEITNGVMPFDQVSLLNPTTEQPEYEAMVEAVRRIGPVVFCHYPGDEGYQGYYFVTDHSLVKDLLREGNLFSSHGLPDRGGGILAHDLSPEMNDARRLMIMLDNPDHAAQRNLLGADFRRNRIERMEEPLRQLARSLVGAAIGVDGVDFVKDIARPIPLAAIAELLGVPEAERLIVVEQGDKITMVDNPRSANSGIDYEAAGDIVNTAELIRQKLIAGEIDNPILEALQNAVYDPALLEILDPPEKIIDPLQFDMFFILLFLAGNETTRNALSHAIAAFAKNPSQWQQLLENPSLLAAAIDEVVRYASPVRYVRRTVMEDTTVGDVEVEAGDKLLLSITGANRTPSIFSNPHEFDITRDPDELKKLVAFGFGPHQCIGRELAKLEIEVVLISLMEKVKNITLTGPVERQNVTLINNISKLPVYMS